MTSYYDVGLICRNGHVVNRSARDFPQRNSKFCTDCGAAAIDACVQCRTPIRGYYHVPGVVSVGDRYRPPSFCHECGTPYPWTEEKLAAAKELALELEDLTDEEREEVVKDLDEVVRDTPRTEVAAFKLRRLLAKAGQEVAGVMKQILVEIATEAAKKQMGL
jgi:hypothetical protein